MVNPTTGVVLSKFVRTPDIDSNGNIIADKFLSTRSDKVHCSIADLEANACSSVDSAVVDASNYRKHDKSGGYEGFSILADGSIAAFLEKKSGDSTLSVSFRKGLFRSLKFAIHIPNEFVFVYCFIGRARSPCVPRSARRLLIRICSNL